MLAHAPVMPTEVMQTLDPRPGETAIDATAGLGGHAVLLARAVGPTGVLVLNDADPSHLPLAKARVEAEVADGPRVVGLHGNFADLARRVTEAGLSADALLADLGFASPHVDDPARGFSFSREGPLDMRYDPGSPTSAAELVNTLPAGELEQMLREFGEERLARQIAQKITAARGSAPITTTTQLADIVRSAVPASRRDPSGIDPATRTFQALRIAVNDELGALSALLHAVERGASLPPASRWLRPHARVALISFHSLEDRLVKQAFGRLVERGLATYAHGSGGRPDGAGDAEISTNPRARSAKLRAIRLTT